MNNEQIQTDAEWGVVELKGHVTMAGRISEEERFGGTMGRVDEPHAEKTVTRYFNRHQVYRLTLCDEATARRVVAHGIWPSSRGYFAAEDDEYFDDDASIGGSDER